MLHPTDEDWLEFLLRSSHSDRTTRMQTHLATRCQECSRTLNIFQAVYEVVQEAFACEPPASVARLAKAVFRVNREWRSTRRLVRGQLVFDSFQQPQCLDLRAAAGPMARELVHKAGSWVIDLHLEHCAHQLLVTGQLLNLNGKDTSTGNFPVFVLQANELVAHAVANRLGEFQFTLIAQNDLHLALKIDREHAITVSLYPPSSASHGIAWTPDTTTRDGAVGRQALNAVGAFRLSGAYFYKISGESPNTGSQCRRLYGVV
jgi:hypothetical protein